MADDRKDERKDDPRVGAVPDIAREREYETGTDERFKGISADLHDNWASNRKNRFDNLIRDQVSFQTLAEDGIHQARATMAQINAITTQHLQNAVHTAHLLNQNSAQAVNLAQLQAVAHRDIAIDNEWNPVQQGTGDNLTSRPVLMDDAALKAIGATVAQALAGVGPAITAAIAAQMSASQPKS